MNSEELRPTRLQILVLVSWNTIADEFREQSSVCVLPTSSESAVIEVTKELSSDNKCSFCASLYLDISLDTETVKVHTSPGLFRLVVATSDLWSTALSYCSISFEVYGSGGVLEGQLRGAHCGLECVFSSWSAKLGLAVGQSSRRVSCEQCGGEAAGCWQSTRNW